MEITWLLQNSRGGKIRWTWSGRRRREPHSRLLLIFLAGILSFHATADSWNYWSTVSDPAPVTGATRAHIATDGTNFYYASLADGVFRADMTNRAFTLMPTNGLPLCSAQNTNALTVWNIVVSPRGTVLIGTQPTVITFFKNGYSIAEQSAGNTTPLIYYWDADSSAWQSASITGNSYPYTQYTGNVSFGADGTVWTCSGFKPYVYKSTDDGRSYTALNLDERIPTNYFSMLGGQTTVGRVFSVVVGPANEIFAGTETAGFLHSQDGGETWTSLDPNFADTNSVDPLGRVGNAGFGGIDRFGNVLCVGTEYLPFPAIDEWSGNSLIAYRPSDGSYWNASGGLPVYSVLPFRIYTTPSAGSFMEMDQDGAGDGGVYRSVDGENWTQFNTGIPALDVPHTGTNAIPGYFADSGDCMAMSGSQVFVADSQMNIWIYDTTPAPITNHPPSALPQNFTLWQNESTNITLGGTDADGDPLNYTIVTQPQNGVLVGTPPSLTYEPDYYFGGDDFFQFVVDDGQATSTVATVSILVNELAATVPAIKLLAPTNLTSVVSPAIVNAQVSAEDVHGIRRVEFWDGINQIGIVTNTPYQFAFNQLAVGAHDLSALAVSQFGGCAWSQPACVVVLSGMSQLSIASASNQINVTWPLNLFGPLLETAPNPNGPWSLVSQPPYDQNYSVHSVVLPAAPTNAYFRLFLAP